MTLHRITSSLQTITSTWVPQEGSSSSLHQLGHHLASWTRTALVRRLPLQEGTALHTRVSGPEVPALDNLWTKTKKKLCNVPTTFRNLASSEGHAFKLRSPRPQTKTSEASVLSGSFQVIPGATEKACVTKQCRECSLPKYEIPKVSHPEAPWMCVKMSRMPRSSEQENPLGERRTKPFPFVRGPTSSKACEHVVNSQW